MKNDRIRLNTQREDLFSPQEREEILNRLLSALKGDPRIAGVLVVGSGAVGFDDCYSDIDISVVATNEKDVLPVYQEWRARIEKLLPVIHCCEVIYGPNSYLYAFLLDGFAELDAGFVCLANLVARRQRWKIAFDRSGKIEDIMRSSWEKKSEVDARAGYLNRIDGIWHYIIHVPVALKRGQPWMALHYLEIIRNRTVELAGLRHRLETKNFRYVDRMPKGFLSELQKSLVSTVDHTAIMNALRVATTCFFHQARALDQMLGLNVASHLESKMHTYIQLFAET